MYRLARLVPLNSAVLASCFAPTLRWLYKRAPQRDLATFCSYASTHALRPLPDGNALACLRAADIGAARGPEPRGSARRQRWDAGAADAPVS